MSKLDDYAPVMTEPEFKVGDLVRTTRYYGETELTHLAEVKEIRDRDYVVRFVEPGDRPNAEDFGRHLVVGRIPAKLVRA